MTTDRSPDEWNLVVRQQEAVARVGQLGLRPGDPEVFLAEALREVADALGVGDVVLLELGDGWHQLEGRAGLHAGEPVPRTVMERLRLPAGRNSLPGFTLEEGQPVTSPDLLGDARFQSRAPDFNLELRSAIAAPIAWTDRPFGVLAAYSRALRSWTADDIHFVQSVASTIGLTVQRSRMEQALRDSSIRLDLSLGAGGLGAWSWNLTTDEVRLSASSMAMYGFHPDAFSGDGDAFLALVHPDDRLGLRGDVFEALQTGGEQHHRYRIIRPGDGDVRWIESWGRLLDDDGPQQLVGVSADVTERRRADEAREAMLLREHQARVEAESARERLAFLAEASARLGRSLDVPVTLASLADLCVPYLADVCLIDLIDEEGQLTEEIGRAVDDRSLVDVRALRRRRAELGGVGGVYSEREVANQGRAVLHTTLTDEDFRAAAVDDDHLELFRRFGGRSALVAPLIGRGRVLGVLSLLCNREGRVYSQDDLALVEEFAARAALALDNARLFHSRNRVARSLQAALLPPALPTVAGLDLAARYQVAEADIEIGGDFYDVIEVGERAWGVVVGDVCGRGPDAAALTGLMRHSVRAAVVRERLPSRVLTQTNSAVIDQIDDAKFCTAAFLRVELPTEPGGPVAVLASSAGHPRPALLRAGGGAELIPCAGTLLGVVPDPRLVDATVELGPGDAVVLYTDGVTEARDGAELFGDDRLLEALAGLAGRSAEEIAAGLEAAVTAFRRSARDDTAILVVRVGSPDGPWPQPG